MQHHKLRQVRSALIWKAAVSCEHLFCLYHSQNAFYAILFDIILLHKGAMLPALLVLSPQPRCWTNFTITCYKLIISDPERPIVITQCSDMYFIKECLKYHDRRQVSKNSSKRKQLSLSKLCCHAAPSFYCRRVMHASSEMHLGVKSKSPLGISVLNR